MGEGVGRGVGDRGGGWRVNFYLKSMFSFFLCLLFIHCVLCFMQCLVFFYSSWNKFLKIGGSEQLLISFFLCLLSE